MDCRKKGVIVRGQILFTATKDVESHDHPPSEWMRCIKEVETDKLDKDNGV